MFNFVNTLLTTVRFFSFIIGYRSFFRIKYCEISAFLPAHPLGGGLANPADQGQYYQPGPDPGGIKNFRSRGERIIRTEGLEKALGVVTKG